MTSAPDELVRARSRAATRAFRTLVATALLVATVAGCAFGQAEWRRESYDTTVVLRGAGDARCSDPAPWTSFRACLVHDAAYELARRERCAGRDAPEHTSEQARLAADLALAHQLALDGYGELWVTVYYLAVRWGGWAPWHVGSCARDPPPVDSSSS